MRFTSEPRRHFTTLLGAPSAFFGRRKIVLVAALLAVVGPSILVLAGVWVPRAIHWQLVMISFGLVGMAMSLVVAALSRDVLHRLENAERALCLRCGAQTRDDGEWQNCDACAGSARREFTLDCWHRMYRFVSPIRPERVDPSKLERDAAFAGRGAFASVCATIVLIPVQLLYPATCAPVIIVPAIGTIVFFLLWRDAIRRRNRIRDRDCVRCSYSLRGLAEFLCPECGYRAEIVSDSDRTQDPEWQQRLSSGNRWMIATLASFALFTGALALAAYYKVHANEIRTLLSGLKAPGSATASPLTPEIESMMLGPTHGMLYASILAIFVSFLALVLCATRFVLTARAERRLRESALTREIPRSFAS